jgi:hypothetical protein
METRRPNEERLMRINFKTASVPTRAAKRLKAALSLKDSTAKEWTARVYGYRNWHDLLNELDTAGASPLDEDCPPSEVAARRQYQAAQLQSCMAKGSIALQLSATTLVSSWQPSAGHPNQKLRLLQTDERPERAAAALLGLDNLRFLRDLSPGLLANMPPQRAAWLDKEACSVARGLMRKGSEDEKRFARAVLEELHAQDSSAGTLHLAISLLLGVGGARDVSRADALFKALLLGAETPENIRAAAADGRSAVRGGGDGWPADVPKALAAWEQKALAGSAVHAYRMGLAFDQFKPATQEARGDLAKAVKFYRIAAENDHAPAAGCLGFILSGNRDLCEYPREGELWLERAAQGGDRLAREVEAKVDAAVALLAAMPKAAAKSQIMRLVEQQLPKEHRGEAEVDPVLGEMVLLPPALWVQLSTGHLFARHRGRFQRIENSYMAADIVGAYPRGPEQAFERMAWAQHHGELLEYCGAHVREQREARRDVS